MATAVAAMSGVPYKLQDTQTTGNGNIISPPPSFKHHQLLISCPTGVTAGAIQPECSLDPNDANTWAPIGGGPITVIASTDIAYNFEGQFMFIRARISTNISGGGAPSVTVSYLGAKSY